MSYEVSSPSDIYVCLSVRLKSCPPLEVRIFPNPANPLIRHSPKAQCPILLPAPSQKPLFSAPMASSSYPWVHRFQTPADNTQSRNPLSPVFRTSPNSPLVRKYLNFFPDENALLAVVVAGAMFIPDFFVATIEVVKGDLSHVAMICGCSTKSPRRVANGEAVYVYKCFSL